MSVSPLSGWCSHTIGERAPKTVLRLMRKCLSGAGSGRAAPLTGGQRRDGAGVQVASAKRPAERSALERPGGALGGWVQVGTPAGKQLPPIDDEPAPGVRHDSHQLGFDGLGPATDAGTDWGAHPQPAAVSGLMSIRQPVSRAANRAFWPSRPIANDNW